MMKRIRALKTGEPKIGTVLNHGTYDSFKNSLTSIALRRGYFDATMPVHQLGVIEDERKAFWDIDFDSGKRYRFGDVTFEGSQIAKSICAIWCLSSKVNIIRPRNWLSLAVACQRLTGLTRWSFLQISSRLRQKRAAVRRSAFTKGAQYRRARRRLCYRCRPARAGNVEATVGKLLWPQL